MFLLTTELLKAVLVTEVNVVWWKLYYQSPLQDGANEMHFVSGGGGGQGVKPPASRTL